MGGHDDWSYYEQEAALEEVFNESLKNISIGSTRDYLGIYGDAIQKRVDTCIREARQLDDEKHYGSAMVLASTAIELIVRFLIVRPLVQGAFLSDEWAGILAERIASGRTTEDRELLPAILQQWGIDIRTIHLSDGSNLWDTVTGQVLPKRNVIVHQGATATDKESRKSIECSETLLVKVVSVLSHKFGFTLDITGRWSEIEETQNGGYEGSRTPWKRFKPRSPFR